MLRYMVHTNSLPGQAYERKSIVPKSFVEEEDGGILQHDMGRKKRPQSISRKGRWDMATLT